jgi:hypothetical protein
MAERITILYDDEVVSVGGALVRDQDLWLRAGALLTATGWELKPEGMCKGAICVPVSEAQRSALLASQDDGDWLDLSAFARMVEQPVARDQRTETWVFGPPAWEWKSRSAGRAPDFSLSDLSGQTHSLSELLGKKVFLLFWASW